MAYLTEEAYQGLLLHTTGLPIVTQVHTFDDIHRFLHGRLQGIDVLHAPAVSPFHLLKYLPPELHARNPLLQKMLQQLRSMQEEFHRLEMLVLQSSDPIKMLEQLLFTQEQPLMIGDDARPGIKNIFSRMRAELVQDVVGRRWHTDTDLRAPQGILLFPGVHRST